MRTLLSLLIFFMLSTTALGADFIVVVNRDGPYDGLKAAAIRDVYLGEKRFIGVVKLEPVNFTEGPLKDTFLKEVVGMTSKEYKLHWIKKVFQEGLSLPRSLGSVDDIVGFVKSGKGAVGYLPASAAAKLKDEEGVIVLGP